MAVVKGKVQIDDTLQTGVLAARPIVVIGDVGVGKTSFFENLYQQLTEKQKTLTYYIHLNLGQLATLSKDVRTFVLLNIPLILKKQYNVNIEDNDFVQRVYELDLIEFDGSVSGRLKEISPLDYEKERILFLQRKLSDAGTHLQASMKYLARTQNRQFILVIDNTDQRSFETQQEAFLIAQELASTRDMLVFVALRPATFYQSKLAGALSGYQNRVLTISPPPADEVLRKRITFAVRVAEGKAASATLNGVCLSCKSIVLFLKATLRSIRSSNKIKTFLGNITGGNTRLIIELITGFCGSPNVECERIVEIEEQTGDYQVPLHEFTKRALLGEYAYYNPLSSLVACNLFDVSLPDPREHFLTALIVAYISSPMGLKDRDGFVVSEAIIREMLRQGFSEDQSRYGLRRLAQKRLIETPHGHFRELPVADDNLLDHFHFRATSIGLYHIRNWAGEFSFIDATSIDTPIFDEAARKIVFEKANSFDIGERHVKASAFKKYLEVKWHDANFSQNYYDLLSIFSAQNESFLSVERYLADGPRPGSKKSYRAGRR